MSFVTQCCSRAVTITNIYIITLPRKFIYFRFKAIKLFKPF